MDIQEMMRKMQEQINTIAGELTQARTENMQMQQQLAEVNRSLPDLASTLDEIQRRNQLAESTPKPDARLQDFSGYKDGSIRKENPEKLPFTGKKDCCPYCTEHGKKSMLDITPTGRWACRQCGKHWYEEALGQKYSKQLEKFIRTGDEDIDPINIFRKEKEDMARDAELDSLKKELYDLKDLILKGALANGKKS